MPRCYPNAFLLQFKRQWRGGPPPAASLGWGPPCGAPRSRRRRIPSPRLGTARAAFPHRPPAVPGDAGEGTDAPSCPAAARVTHRCGDAAASSRAARRQIPVNVRFIHLFVYLFKRCFGSRTCAEHVLASPYRRAPLTLCTTVPAQLMLPRWAGHQLVLAATSIPSCSSRNEGTG